MIVFMSPQQRYDSYVRPFIDCRQAFNVKIGPVALAQVNVENVYNE